MPQLGRSVTTCSPLSAREARNKAENDAKKRSDEGKKIRKKARGASERKKKEGAPPSKTSVTRSLFVLLMYETTRLGPLLRSLLGRGSESKRKKGQERRALGPPRGLANIDGVFFFREMPPTTLVRRQSLALSPANAPQLSLSLSLRRRNHQEREIIDTKRKKKNTNTHVSDPA